MPTPAIEIRNLTKQFRVREKWFRSRKLTALEDVSFSIGSGEAFGLIGPNGSGKSTLLRILSTVLIPTAGQAWVQGVPVSRPRSIKALLGVIPSEAKGFSRELSGRQNLEFFAALQRLGLAAVRGRVEQLLERVGIAGLGEQPVWTYSTGQRQRLNIARALLHDPAILLFDEPTKGLDPRTAGEIRLWIREEMIHRQGKTLLIASNQMEDIGELCDRVVLLWKGRSTFTGLAKEAQELSAANLS
jgi:ABC-2 type transport system ATP-binding protein